MSTRDERSHFSDSWFIGIDSDGCVFDNMSFKHIDCFVPAFIQHFGLSEVGELAAQTWVNVSLKRRTRGINRFKALALCLAELSDQVGKMDVELIVPRFPDLDSWIERESKLGQTSLKREIEKSDSEELARIFSWSEEVNRRIQNTPRQVQPFPGAASTLGELIAFADCMVISSAPTGIIRQEWTDHHLIEGIVDVAGQERGSKGLCIHEAIDGHYDPEHCLMIGDSPGDLQAARENGILFFPIIPGDEKACWMELGDTGIRNFREKSFSGSYQDELIERFYEALPETD